MQSLLVDVQVCGLPLIDHINEQLHFFVKYLVLLGRFWWKDYISKLCILELMISNPLTAFGLARYLCADTSTFFSCTFVFFLSPFVCLFKNFLSACNFLILLI